METPTVIMVQIADHAWTLEALHCAGILARQQAAKVALVKMIAVQHLSWLGTDMAYLNLSAQDHRETLEYQSTLEDYGVDYDLSLFQYVSLDDAIVQAADHLDAQIVFATLPRSVLPFWRSYQLQNVRRRLAQHQREWVEHPVYVQAPTSLKPVAASEG